MVGGMTTLDKFERNVQCDPETNRPLNCPSILSTEIFQDAFEQAEAIRSGKPVELEKDPSKESSLFGYGKE